MYKKLPKLDLNITNRCNFRCVHCAFDSGITKMDELSVPELKKILEDTRELGGERIDITGGEPLLREDLEDILRVGKSLGYRIELVTNGSLLTTQKLQRFKELGLDALAISLDGSNFNEYARIRNVDYTTYKRVIKTIMDACNLGFYTKINTVVFKSNLENIPSITQFCIATGVKEHGLYYFSPVGRGNSAREYSVEPSTLLKCIREKLMMFDSRIKLSIEVPFIEKGLLKKECGCIMKDDPYHLQILPDGKVYPCAILASYKKPLANVHDVSVKDIWCNTKLWDDYSAFVEAEVFQKYCGACVDYHAFATKKYQDYTMICPLRKFNVGELNV